VLGNVLGVQQGTSATSFQVDEGSGTENAAFFKAAFGVVEGARRFVVLKSAGAAAVGPRVVFVQSFRSDTTSLVSKSALADCVFECVSHGAGKAAGEGFKGGGSAAEAAAGGGGAGAGVK